MDEISGAGVPDFAGSVIASRDKFVPVFVEAAVGEREYMSFEFLN